MIDVAIIGAGPYGLSLAAHLRAAGVNFRVFGKTMELWRRKMPPGMLLKSHPWSSYIYDPEEKLTFEKFCRQEGLDYHPAAMETPLDLYCRYGEAFQKQFAPDVVEKMVADLTAVAGGFRIVLDDGEAVSARRVVLAVGVYPFSHLPEALAGLPSGAVSHSSDYGPLDRLAGRKVVVVGSGASAIDTAVLLSERGAAVTLLARASELYFAKPPLRVKRPLWRQLARPGSGIGAGWLLWICARRPWLIHSLPGPVRRHLVRNTLGPLGGAAMEARLVGKLPVLLGWDVERADLVSGRVELHARDRRGAEQVLTADHVIAATGYRIDLERLSFLSHGLRRAIRTAERAPVLSRDYETSVRGLHVIGPASADSFGPVCRFVYGAIYPARRLARRFSRDAARQPDSLQSDRLVTAAEGV